MKTIDSKNTFENIENNKQELTELWKLHEHGKSY